MACVDVTTQQGLDAAIDRGDHPHLTGDGEFTVTDSATVEASDSATVRAYGSATVRASSTSNTGAHTPFASTTGVTGEVTA